VVGLPLDLSCLGREGESAAQDANIYLSAALAGAPCRESTPSQALRLRLAEAPPAAVLTRSGGWIKYECVGVKTDWASWP
jgi:hypothetical protein